MICLKAIFNKFTWSILEYFVPFEKLGMGRGLLTPFIRRDSSGQFSNSILFNTTILYYMIYQVYLQRGSNQQPLSS